MLINLKTLRIFTFFVIILLIGSCKTTKEVVRLVDEYQFENSLLWEIDGNGLDEPSYLFGTIHLIEAENFFWPDATLGSFEKAGKIVFEIDLDEMFDISSQLSLLTKAFMNDGHKLSDFYSDEDYKEVKSHFENMGIPMFFLERIKPMFLTVFASGDIDITSGFGDDSSVKSYEMELYEMAQASKLEVEGLESMEFQMSVFDSIPYQEQADMLLESVRTSNTENDAFKVMTEMYLSQDINAMIEAMGEEGGIEDYEDLLLYQRNRNWIPVMAQKMQSGTVFFAVGAGHLGGKDGVLDLLRKAGYDITPLSHKKSS